MCYRVGQACAVAGSTSLYRELDLLPDISIAEGEEIYGIIMTAPKGYAVINYYTRSIDLETPQTPAFLQGEMKPRWSLEKRTPSQDLPITSADGIYIEQNGVIGIEATAPDDSHFVLGPEEAKVLWTPPPLNPDLPIFERTILTQMATYDENMDRYVRLMHPEGSEVLMGFILFFVEFITTRCLLDGGQAYSGQVNRYVWLSPGTICRTEKDEDGFYVDDTDWLYSDFEE
ncbi:hypothetical protein N7457_004768 [Penicillium paradoxum]|uniref:uncharacterized protein n=1 Tax=Penicillium paradoxum TaxID=176176 RepID=UPI002547CBE6|nr:uncharacterized protein N7457_004768 [Penicillium paradoxum]KAJ5782994.1 hypothetical protein N7457_004768 [Penicillium paradoxum]